MTLLTKEIKFEGKKTENLIDKTVYFFNQSGFNLVDKNANTLRFTRGSLISNMWTFNPLNWKSDIIIEIKENKVNAIFKINTTGQMVTVKEENLWDSFIQNFRIYLIEGIDFKIINKEELRRTKLNSLKYFGWAVLGGLIVGVPAGFIAYWTGINSIVSIGAAGGAIGLMSKKIHDEKKKNAL